MAAFPTIGRRADFDALARSGATSSCRLLVVRVRRTHGEVTRIGMSTPRSIGGAVRRNRTRRRIRELLRVRYASLPSGWDLLVIARPAAGDAPSSQLAEALDGLLRRSGIGATA